MELPSKTLLKVQKRLSPSALRHRNIKWFKEFYFTGARPKSSFPEPNKSPFKFVIGKIYSFLYFDPKYKEELDFYNAVPVGVFIGYHKSGNPMFLALQFIPPKIRIEVLDKICTFNQASIDKSMEIIRKSGFSQRKLDAQYGDLKMYLKKSGFEFAIRSYIITRIQTQPAIITYWDWWRLSTFSGQYLMKKNVIAIYNEYKKFKQSQ